MEVRYIIAPGVRIEPIDEMTFRVDNGHDASTVLSRDAVSVLRQFSKPKGTHELVDNPVDRDVVHQFVQAMLKKLILIPVDTTPTDEMRLTWDYLAQGGANRALYFIDNESKSMDEFATSGMEGVCAIHELISISKEASVLTIGCGMGRLEYTLSLDVARIEAFDISLEMVQLAKQYLKERSNVSVSVTDGTFDQVKFQSIDVVLSFLVFQHITRETLWTYFSEAHRVLKEDGDFLFQIHLYDDVKGEAPTTSIIDRYYGLGKTRFHEREIRAQLHRHGFEIEWIRDGRYDTKEKRLVGTKEAWRSVLIYCRAKKRGA